jgi:predicted amidohydrolase
MAKVTVATTAMRVAFDKKANLAKYMKFIDDAAKQHARLIVFPEQSLQGYLHNLGQWRPETLEYQHKNAEVVPEGESIQQLIEKAKEKNIYIVCGMTEVAPEEGGGVLYNTNVLVGPEGFIGKYRKTHQPLDECHVYYPGNGWSVQDIGFAKVGMLICYDKAFPESCRELVLQGAEILIMPTAWPLAAHGADPKTDYCAYLADIFERARAAENQVWFISSNHVGMSGDHQMFGNSRIVYPDGRDYAEIPYMEEGLLVRTIDVQSEIVKARTLAFLGLCMVKDRRPSACTHIAQE